VHDRVVVVDADPGWAAAYAAEETRLRAAAAGRFVAVEHVGSTAVPGLAAKPTIDVLAAIADTTAIAELVPLLAALGYDYRPRIPNDVDVALFRRIVDGHRTHHLHVVLAADFAGDARRRFRDILRARPDLAAAYAALKRELADRLGHDRPAYTDAKTDFVLRVLREA
jgi:GrpB-like predicted nucleotidyltransferase (UPF0157 family)